MDGGTLTYDYKQILFFYFKFKNIRQIYLFQECVYLWEKIPNLFEVIAYHLKMTLGLNQRIVIF